MISRRLFLRAAPVLPAAFAATADAEDPKRIVWMRAGEMARCADGSMGPFCGRCFIFIDGVDTKGIVAIDMRGPVAFVERMEMHRVNGRMRPKFTAWRSPITYIETIDRARIRLEFRGSRDRWGVPI